MRTLVPVLLLELLLPIPHMLAQHPSDDYLSETEVDQLRDAAPSAADRVRVFIKLLDTRADALKKLTTGPRQPGREQDIHNQLQQFYSIADEFADNLDDYGSTHRDMRKALPKLLEATTRWTTILQAPPQSRVYEITRKLALQAVQDLRDSATQLISDQAAWFAVHPPPKHNRDGTITIPR